jgi:hypothetical protein
MRVVAYGAEVVGRLQGAASMPVLVPDAAHRAAVAGAAERLLAGTHTLMTAAVAELMHEFLENRVAVGRGKAVDRGFERVVGQVSNGVRDAVPDRSTAHPSYRKVFAGGSTAAYTEPTIKQDPEAGAELRRAIVDSGVSVRDDVLGLIDAIAPIVGTAATAVRDGEAQVNTLWAAEVKARQELVDLLWSERKQLEGTLGRPGRGMVQFLFFDFQKNRPGAAGEDPVPTADEPAAPAATSEPH